MVLDEAGHRRLSVAPDDRRRQEAGLDLGAVATHLRAARVEGGELARQVGGVADDVEVARVAGRETERLLLAAAPDEDREVVAHPRLVHRGLRVVPTPVDRRTLAAQHRRDDRQRLVQPLEPVGERAELEPELLVLQLEPAGADPEHGPAAADDVERRHGLRQVGGVPVGVPGDERRELDAGGRGGQRRQRRVRLEHRLVRGPDAGQLVEVVHHEHRVEPGVLGLTRLRDDSREEVGRRGCRRRSWGSGNRGGCSRLSTLCLRRARPPGGVGRRPRLATVAQQLKIWSTVLLAVAIGQAGLGSGLGASLIARDKSELLEKLHSFNAIVVIVVAAVCVVLAAVHLRRGGRGGLSSSPSASSSAPSCRWSSARCASSACTSSSGCCCSAR